MAQSNRSGVGQAELRGPDAAAEHSPIDSHHWIGAGMGSVCLSSKQKQAGPGRFEGRSDALAIYVATKSGPTALGGVMTSCDVENCWIATEANANP
jgi:hypothetical protein